MTMRFDLSGRTSLTLVGGDEDAARYVRSQMDPYAPSEGSGGGVVLQSRTGTDGARVVELQNPAGDGTVTASDGRDLALLADGRACTVPRPGDERPRFVYDSGFPLWRVLGDAVRPALQIDMLSREAAAVHSASVLTAPNGAVLVAGWSESGKTETALALIERGAEFLSDKWTIVGSDSTAAAFPIGVGIRRWVLRYLPRMKSSLPRSSRAQFAAAATAEMLAKPLLRRPARGRIAGLAREVAARAIALADRAGLTPSDIHDIYGSDGSTGPVPLRAVAVLVNVPGDQVRCEQTDADWASARLARSAAYERRPYFALAHRRGFAFEREELASVEAVIERERALLRPVLEAAHVLRVEAPFPTDPRAVAAAIEAEL